MTLRRLLRLAALCTVMMVLLASLPALANQSTKGFYLGKTLMGRIIVAEQYSTQEFRVTGDTRIISSNPEHDEVAKIPKHSVIQVVHDGRNALTIIVVEVPQ